MIYSIIDPVPIVQDTKNGTNQIRPYENEIKAKCMTKLGDIPLPAPKAKHYERKLPASTFPLHHMAKSKMKYRNLNPLKMIYLKLRTELPPI